MKERTWERVYSIFQKIFSFHASRPILLIRGLILFVIGLIGLYHPDIVLRIVTMAIGGVLLLFAVASFLMAWQSGRFSPSLLLLFFLLGAAGIALLFFPLKVDKFVMFAIGVWLIITGVWSIISVQKRGESFVLPMSGVAVFLIGVLLVIAPFIVTAFTWVAALLMLLCGAQMFLLALGVDGGKLVFPNVKRREKR